MDLSGTAAARVLVVDDEPEILMEYSAILAPAPKTGADAQELPTARRGPVLGATSARQDQKPDQAQRKERSSHANPSIVTDTVRGD